MRHSALTTITGFGEIDRPKMVSPHLVRSRSRPRTRSCKEFYRPFLVVLRTPAIRDAALRCSNAYRPVNIASRTHARVRLESPSGCWSSTSDDEARRTPGARGPFAGRRRRLRRSAKNSSPMPASTSMLWRPSFRTTEPNRSSNPGTS